MPYFFTLLVALVCTVMQCSAAPLSSSTSNSLPSTFLNLDSLDYVHVLQPPPEQGSYAEKSDHVILHCTFDTATPEQINYAMSFIKDSVFDYSEVLGSHFNKKECPITAAFFDVVTADVFHANTVAKSYFKHPRPDTWKKMTEDDPELGYSYPSAHTARAFVWAELLSQLLPQYKNDFYKEAEKKAWSRVILGRHYPSDVCAGKVYAHYLVQQLLANPDFQNPFKEVQEELSQQPFC